MKSLFPLHGIVTVLNTPFDQRGAIDLSALAQHVEEALKAGVAGFLVPALASEVHKLTLDERLAMVNRVLQTVDDKVPVFAGAGGKSLDESQRIMKAYKKLGCRHALIQLPFDNAEKFKNDFFKVAEQGPEVLMLQDWEAHGYGLPDELILELFEDVPSFRCLKIETVPAGVKYSRMLELTGGKLNISGGWAVMQMPEALQRGVHAFMPTGMHWIYTAIFNDYKNGREKKAVELFNELLPVLAFSNQHLDISIHFFKRLLWKQGIYPTPDVREPAIQFDAIHQGLADQLIEKIMQIEHRIKTYYNGHL